MSEKKINLTKKQRECLEAMAESIKKNWEVFHLDKKIKGVRFHITYSRLIGAF